MMANIQTRFCLLLAGVDVEEDMKVEAAFTYVEYMQHDIDWVDHMYIEFESIGGW